MSGRVATVSEGSYVFASDVADFVYRPLKQILVN